MPATSSRRRAARRTGAVAAALGTLGLVGLGAAPTGSAAPAPVLVLSTPTPVNGAQPGGETHVPVSFTNTGSTALDQVWITYNATGGLSPAEVPSNCESYQWSGGYEVPGTQLVHCGFKQAVEPGVVYAPESALPLKVEAKALYEHVQVQLDTVDLGSGDNTSVPVKGTGPEVKLVTHPDEPPAAPGSGSAYGVVDVNADSTADFQVTGAQLKGAVGTTVPLSLTFTNAGPGWLEWQGDSPLDHVRVTMPAGTTVTKNASYCTKVTTGTYDCRTPNIWLDPKDKTTYAFTLRIDKAVPDAKGSITLTGDRPFDHVASNDTADILLDTTAAGSTGSTSTSGGTTTGGNSPTANGNSASSELAATGFAPALPLTAAGGALLLGAAAVLTTHRRTARQR